MTRYIFLRSTLVCVLCLLTSAGAVAFTSSEHIVATVKAFIVAENQAVAPASVEKTEVQVSNLDSRLRLADCDENLTLAVQNKQQLPGRSLVKVSCSASQPWSIYVPANVVWYQTVVSSRTPLPRAQVLAGNDVYLQQVKITRAGNAYYSNLEDVVGKLLTRRVGANQPLTAALLQAADLVHKGDAVVVLAIAGAISVRTEGVALASGAAGEQIQVKNNVSDRVVKAEVIGRGRVKVLM